MQIGFKLGTIKIEELGLELNNVEVNLEAGIGEVKGAYALQKQIIKEMPETLEDLKTAFIKYEEINKELEEEAIRKAKEEIASTFRVDDEEF